MNFKNHLFSAVLKTDDGQTYGVAVSALIVLTRRRVKS